MALPTILINSATGSDTQASGAGPSTALFGTTDASTSGDGLTVTLTAGTDLTNVLTDGSHVIFLNDSTAGARNFGKITGKAGSGGATPTVTVADAFGISLTSKSWAIGGKRASIFNNSNSLKLFENNAGNGDAMPGWIIEMQSGHSETYANAVTIRRAGDSTDGPITLRGESGAATLPLLTHGGTSSFIVFAVAGWKFMNFELRNNNATKTGSAAFSIGTGQGYTTISGIKCNHSTDKFNNFISIFANGGNLLIENNTIGYCNGVGIDHAGGNISGSRITNNIIYKCGSNGIVIAGTFDGLLFKGNILAFNTGDGFQCTNTSEGSMHAYKIVNNTFHGNGGDGIEFTQATLVKQALMGLLIENNAFTYNGGYGLNFSGASITEVGLRYLQVTMNNNGFYQNTSGKYNLALTFSDNEITTDPSNSLTAATKDYAGVTDGTNFSVGSAYQAKGHPLGGTTPIGKYSSTYSYVDIGAAQHIDTVTTVARFAGVRR